MCTLSILLLFVYITLIWFLAQHKYSEVLPSRGRRGEGVGGDWLYKIQGGSVPNGVPFLALYYAKKGQDLTYFWYFISIAN